MKKTLLILILIANFAIGNAQWNGTTTVNNPVSTTSITTTKVGNVSTTDGAGGMFIAWIDSRTSSNQSIYVQRILANGSLAFANEILITNAITAVPNSGNKSNLNIESDGAGGAILVWLDPRNITATPVNNNNEVFGQRINATGTALWTAGGIRMTVFDNIQSAKITPKVSVINTTEAIVVFGDNRLGNSDLFAQKITLSTGAKAWANDVSVHGNQLGTSTNISQIPDGNNGLFLTWQDARPGAAVADIYAQRIDNSGMLLWGASATAVCNNAGLQSSPSICLDGAAGVVITWQDARTAATDADIYAQRLNDSGLEQWNSNGVAICVQTSTNQTNPFVIQGGSGFVVIWSDQRAGTGQRNIYTNSLDINGATTWTTAAAGGLPICVATGNQPTSSVTTGMQILSDGSNGAIVVWDDGRNATSDIYAQKVNNLGAMLWMTNGVIVSDAIGNQIGPNAVADGVGNTIIAWRDARGGTANGEIYTSKLKSDGVLPLNIVEINASIINNLPTVNWKTSSELNAEKYILQRSDDGINFYDVIAFNANGQDNSNYHFTDKISLTNIITYRIKAVNKDGEINYSANVKLFTNNKNLAINIFPNPAQHFLNVELSNLKNGNYTIRFYDLKGALIKTQSVKIEASYNILPLEIIELKTGIYNVQITGNDLNISKTISVFK